MTNKSAAEHDGASGAWDASDPGHAELVQMRIRMIATENLILAILSEASEEVRQSVRDRAVEIAPRRGSSDHPLTHFAQKEMLSMLARAERREG